MTKRITMLEDVMGGQLAIEHLIRSGHRNIGLSVPADIDIIGYDDINLAALVTPSLTTVHIPIVEIGEEINYRNFDTTPTEVGHLFNDPDELIIPKVIFDRGSIPPVFKAIVKLRKKYND